MDKSRGRYEVVRSFGSVRTAAEADLLENKAREFVREQEQEPETLFGRIDAEQLRDYARTLDQGRIELAGPELVFGELFDRLHLGAGRSPLFRHLVICRLFDPGSKLRTVGYLQRYLGESCAPAAIYSLIDGLHLTDFRIGTETPSAACLLPTPLSRVPFCLLLDAAGRPVAGRLLDRRADGKAGREKSMQRLARKYGAPGPVVVERAGARGKNLSEAFRMSPKDLNVRPMLRRKKGRVEGHLCICLAAYAVQVELERLLAAHALTLPAVREAVGTLFRLNYVSPHTRRPKSVLIRMTLLQKQLFDLIHRV